MQQWDSERRFGSNVLIATSCCVRTPSLSSPLSFQSNSMVVAMETTIIGTEKEQTMSNWPSCYYDEQTTHPEQVEH